MRGHICKRGNSYSIVLSNGRDPVTGKYRYEWIAVKGNHKDAEKLRTEILHQRDQGSYVKPTKNTVGEYLQSWLRDSCWPNLAPRSAEGYEYIVKNHLLPTIGDKPLTSLRPEHLQRLYADKQAGLSARTVRYIHSTLHKALRDAVRLGILSRNPADAVTPHKLRRHEMQTMSEADLHLFLEYAKDTPHYALFYTALFTGMRRSELLALRWGDVDLLLCQLSVTRTINQLHSGRIVYGEPKTAKSRRVVSLTPSSALVLQEHREAQAKQRQELGAPMTDDDLVFSQLDGGPLLPDSITHAWAKLAKATGLTGIRLHDARHTHASIMLKQGVHPKIVQERLGHSTIAVTLDVYSHVAPGLQQAAANRFDDIVINRGGATTPEKAH